MSTSGGGCSNVTSDLSGIRPNISVTNINCPSSAINSIDLSNGANELTTNANSLTNNSGEVQHHNVNNKSNSFANSLVNDGLPTSGSVLQQQLNNNPHFYGNGSIRIAVPKMEESDESETELSQIESAATTITTTTTPTAVSMRTSNNNKSTPRPMSWEGELSENEDQMETDANSKPPSAQPAAATATNNNEVTMNAISYATNGNADKSIVKPRAIITSELNDNTEKMIDLDTKVKIKPEYNSFAPNASATTAATAATTTTTPDANHAITMDANKRYPFDMSNMKFETNLQSQHIANQFAAQQQQQNDINSSTAMMRTKANNILPTNPSPDSAIHSVYTHSSPSQSPLTSRHTPYTPSLSRNNSDASYSSCYSYSSEFSPTHSPIQGRHNMYAGGNFNGSPLHHSVLYKPMMDGNDNAKTLQHQQSNEENVLEPEIIPSAGISRQQLINRYDRFDYSSCQLETMCNEFYQLTFFSLSRSLLVQSVSNLW